MSILETNGGKRLKADGRCRSRPVHSNRRTISPVPRYLMRTGSFTTLLVSPLAFRSPARSGENPEPTGEPVRLQDPEQVHG